MHLKTGNARHGPVRGADFSRVIRKSRQTVTINSGGTCKEGTGQLHTIPGIASKPDDDIAGIDYLMFHRLIIDEKRPHPQGNDLSDHVQLFRLCCCCLLCLNFL